MRSSWITGVCPKSNDKCSYERQKGRRHREEGHVEMEGEIGVTQSQAKGFLEQRSWTRKGRILFWSL